MENEPSATETPGGGTNETATPTSPLPGPDTQSSLELETAPGNGDNGTPEAVVETSTPQEDPDGDTAFENEFGSQLTPGFKTRLSKLQEQRNAARGDMAKLQKQYEFYKDYVNPDGQQYVKTLLDFNDKFKTASVRHPWLGQILNETVYQGQDPNWQELKDFAAMQLGPQAPPTGQEYQPDGEATVDPRYQALEQRMQGWEQQQAQQAQQVQFQTEVDAETKAMKTEIAEFEGANPEFKDNADFITKAIRLSMAQNSSFKEAADSLAGFMGNYHKSQLEKVAKADQAGAGAQVSKGGPSGVPVSTRPKLGSEEERIAMEAFYTRQA